MLRVSKLADYATVLLAYMAKRMAAIYNARDLSLQTHIALPTVSKILKLLVRKNVLTSLRGSKGGYQLQRDPASITVAEILSAIDGDFGITDCSHEHSTCSLETLCAIRSNWQGISRTIYQGLQHITLAHIAEPQTAALIPAKNIKFNPRQPQPVDGDHHGH